MRRDRSKESHNEKCIKQRIEGVSHLVAPGGLQLIGGSMAERCRTGNPACLKEQGSLTLFILVNRFADFASAYGTIH
jgi:hypothetical protein